MNITIHSSMLPQDDPDAALAFYRDTLGFEVRNDVEYGGMHWITVGPREQPDTSIVLYPPATTPGITDDERRVIAEMMAKGTYASINLATTDVDRTFERLQASDAEVTGGGRYSRGWNASLSNLVGGSRGSCVLPQLYRTSRGRGGRWLTKRGRVKASGETRRDGGRDPLGI